MTPTNLKQEETAFFQNGCKVNPRFFYEDATLAIRYSKQFQLHTVLFPLAKKILQHFKSIYGNESQYLQKEGGPILSKQETEKVFMNYLKSINLHHRIVISFSQRAIAPTSISYDRGTAKLIVGYPPEYREKLVRGSLHHEVCTHFLRKDNDRKTGWRKKEGLKGSMETEEGLASLNQLIDLALDPSRSPVLFKAALYYYSAVRASELSFIDLYQDLGEFIDNPGRRWRQCVRVKRGVQDTSEPGGFFKDQVYLKGSVEILRKRHQIEDFRVLFSSKISLEDALIKQNQKKSVLKGTIMPPFLEDQSLYREALNRIASENFIE